MTSESTPPLPKYWLGESIVFDRAAYPALGRHGEGRQIGLIHMVEIRISSEKQAGSDTGEKAHQWAVHYWTEHDDPVPEECILGPCVAGPAR